MFHCSGVIVCNHDIRERLKTWGVTKIEWMSKREGELKWEQKKQVGKGGKRCLKKTTDHHQKASAATRKLLFLMELYILFVYIVAYVQFEHVLVDGTSSRIVYQFEKIGCKNRDGNRIVQLYSPLFLSLVFFIFVLAISFSLSGCTFGHKYKSTKKQIKTVEKHLIM